MTTVVKSNIKGARLINSQFFNLNAEKQERIINGAMKEFVLRGFEKASTNEIVKEAQISKGSLFHYFNNKKDLYLFLIEDAKKAADMVLGKINMDERDIFKRLSGTGLVKLDIQKRYPLLFDFLRSVAVEDSKEVKVDTQQILGSILQEGFSKIYENIDWSKFKEGTDPEKALHILNWTMTGFAEMQMSKAGALDRDGAVILKEWESYSELLKQAFYKEGE
ncbi:TetR/AcrR family transcriptional regulator [Metabacillus mangrovi]|uniref:TetR/AcrR family transcriptional regulator n=1 Tax=Metabacillus mangrovi TaxID=1491830 RepID=UPI001883635C|nr:TetR/AcrR family transcriptional regulator [Metabacillus mangrovi]